MTIFKEDLEKGLDPLPVRQGCSGFACACTGVCRKVIGIMSRNDYLKFMLNYISPEDFIKRAMSPVPEDEMFVVSVFLGRPTEEKRMVMMGALKALFPEHNLVFFRDLLNAGTIEPGDVFYDFLVGNREKMIEVFKEFGGFISYNFKSKYD